MDNTLSYNAMIAWTAFGMRRFNIEVQNLRTE